MAPGQYYDKVSENEDIDLDSPVDKPVPKSRWSWGQQSLLIRTIIIAVYTILIATICSAIVEYRHDGTITKSAPNANTGAVSSEADNSMPAINITTPTPGDGLAEIRHCGSNAAEARSLECVYDVMMQLWMPEPCYDSVLSERFLKLGNWTWWADEEAKIVMTDEEMKKGEHSVAYMLQDYHKHHCVFAMEKLVRALRNQWPLIPELVSYDHIVHCRHKTLMRSDVVRGVRAPTGFTACAPYSVWKNQLPEDHVSSTE